MLGIRLSTQQSSLRTPLAERRVPKHPAEVVGFRDEHRAAGRAAQPDCELHSTTHQMNALSKAPTRTAANQSPTMPCATGLLLESGDPSLQCDFITDLHDLVESRRMNLHVVLAVIIVE
jgi:hypothetical protein